MISSSYLSTNKHVTISLWSSVSNIGATQVRMVRPTMIKSIADDSLPSFINNTTAGNEMPFIATIEINTNEVDSLVGLSFDAYGTQELATPADRPQIRKPIKTFT